jgi:hypothetical protein
MVLRQAMTLVVIGLAIGVTGALAVARVVTCLLFGMGATDPATFGGVCLILLIVAMAASYVPCVAGEPARPAACAPIVGCVEEGANFG